MAGKGGLKSSLKKMFFFAASIALLIYVFAYLVDWPDLLKSLENLSYIYLIPVIILAILRLLVENYKFTLYARKCGRISQSKAFPIFMTGVLFNAITPGARTGGEIVRGFYLQKELKCDAQKAIASSYVSAAMYVPAFLMFSLSSIIFIFLFVDVPTAITTALLIVLIIMSAVASIIYLIYKKHHRLAESLHLDLILRFFYWIANRDKYETYELYKAHSIMKFSKFVQYWKSILTDKSLFFKTSMIQATALLIYFLKVFIIFLAFGKYINPLLVIAVTSVSMLIGFFLILPAGIGVTEASMISLYTAFNISTGLGAAVTIIDRAIFYLLTYGGGGLAFAWMSIKYHIKPSLDKLAKNGKH